MVVMGKNNKTAFVTVTLIMMIMALSNFALANTMYNVQVFAQANSTNATTSTSASQQNSPIASTIDKAINSIKSGDNDNGKKQLLSA